jgi:radical SAM superfamily enzyme YgiQ (UPF0313 family)
MKVLLVSGYELGHQPYHLGLAASCLLEDGHEVLCLDLSVQDATSYSTAGLDAVAISAPMHTAARIGVEFARSLRGRQPEVPIAFFGLYAHVAVDSLSSLPVGEGSAFDAPTVGFGGEYKRALRDWAKDPAGISSRRAASTTISLERQPVGLPARHLLPPLDNYARLLWHGEERLVGYLEATSGCSHKCRHCPVPIVYSGRIRKAETAAILADVEQLVGAGASHISFGDPDFLNAPSFAVGLAKEVHACFPDLTFDCTAKVEHIIRHEDVWASLAEAGFIFVISAFETTNPEILRILDKGHSPSDLRSAVEILRRHGIEPRPSFLPFTPWTKPRDPRDILDLCVDLDLVSNVDPVQFSLKLLVPKGSLLLATDELRAAVGDYDNDAMSYRWKAQHTETLSLQATLERIAGDSLEREAPLQVTLEAMAAEIARSSPEGVTDDARFIEEVVASADSAKIESRPRLSESWFCCAEPVASQLQTACGAGEVCA